MRAWEPLHNPYIVGNPIKGSKLFFGRKEDFAYINSKFVGGKEGGLVVLCGARRSGKTSILFQILDGRLGAGFLPVLVDMQSMAIVNDRQLVRRLLELIEYAATDAGFSPGSAEITDSPFSDIEAYVARLLRVLGERKLLLAFDEYELIESGIDSGAISTQLLRTLANLIEHRQVFVVFTGSQKLEERNKTYWDVFLSKALHRRISFLSHEDTMRLIHEPVEGLVEYAPGVPERIYDLTAGQPFYTQVICQNLIDHLNDERKRVVTLDDVERVVEEVVQNPLPQMIFHWNALADLQKLALAIMAELGRKQRQPVAAASMLAFVRAEKLGYNVDPNMLNKELDRLFHGDLVQRDEKQNRYEFKMDLWRLWAMRMHSVWQVIGEIDQGGGPGTESGISVARPPAPAWRKYVYVAAAAALVVVGAFAAWRAIQRDRNDMSAVGESVPASLAGVLDISTSPPGADVFIDGVARGRSPFHATVAAGSHAVRAEMSGFGSATENVSTAAGDTTAVGLTLVELSGEVLVETEPAGARVTFDGGTSMPSPARRQLSVTKPHRVLMSLKGYESASYEVHARADSTVRVRHEFSRQTAPLAISSDPGGARVNIDGQDEGTTPFATTRVNYGSHEITVTLAGYEPWVRTVDIPIPNDRLDVMLTRQEGGRIEIRVKPWASLYLDGRLIAETVSNRTLPVDAGAHVVELRNPAFSTFTKQVVVNSGETHVVDHTFKE